MSSVAELSAEINASLRETESAFDDLASDTIAAARLYDAMQMPAGVYPDMTMADYLALPLMSAGRLEKLRKSPLQYQHSLIAPQKSSSALERGTALHLAILEPLLFDGHYVVLGRCEGIKKDKDRCNKNASLVRNGKHYCGTHDPRRGFAPEDVEIIGSDDHAKVLGMRDAVLGHKRAASLFEGKGAFETTIIFDDPETGVRCKIRPDRLIERAGMLVDVKTCKCALPHAFAKQAEDLGYWRKLALYRRGLRAIGWPIREIAVLAIESEPPFDLNPFLTEPEDIDGADEEVTELLMLFNRCTRDDYWPGYASSEDGFTILRRPEWARKRKDDNGDS